MISLLGHRTCSSMMLFFVFSLYLPYFSLKYEFKFNIMAVPKNWSCSTGPQLDTIRHMKLNFSNFSIFFVHQKIMIPAIVSISDL